MAATPKKLVHWALDVSLSDFGSPFFEATSSDSISSTSSFQYVNSQLVAHGYAEAPGLSLEGLGKDDTTKVVKCLLGMLSQRVNDMSRTEDLTTKIRTMSYDNERLMCMYKAATDRAANAEREMNLHKTRLANTTRTLQSTELAHKQTTAELQRTRTALQAVRTAHQTEIKKLEKEKERMVERWNKVSDSQLRAAVTSGGMKPANFEVVEASDVQQRGKGLGFLDTALEEAQHARKELFEQNRKLRGLILSAANEMQSIQHTARSCASSQSEEEPSPLTLTALFPISPTEAAGEKINSLLSCLRESITRLSKSSASPPPSAPVTQVKSAESVEVERLQAVIDTLRSELEQAQKQSSDYATQIQSLFDRYAEDQRIHRPDIADASVDLMTVPARDEERQRLDARFKELEDERKKFTEAAVRLGREKAALEVEHIRFLEEKRSWQVDMMLADLPPTPGPSSEPPPAAPPAVENVAPPRSPRRSLRHSPRKPTAALVVKKSGSGKKSRVSRRSSGNGAALGPVSPKKVMPPFETEVIPSPSKQLPEFKTNITFSQPPAPLAAPAFILPPPSPAAALPQSSLSQSSLIPYLPPLIPETESATALSSSKSNDDVSPKLQPTASNPSSTAPAPELPVPVPSTPVPRRPFPMAKPLVPHMVHAYSPAKPSPLSRILMLANSPDSPEDVPRLGALTEQDEEDDDVEVSPTPRPSTPAPVAFSQARSLAEELGIASDDSDDEAPLREQKKAVRNVVKARPAHAPARPTVTKGNNNARNDVSAAPRGATGVVGEKENVKRAKSSTSGVTMKATASARDDKKTAKPPPKPTLASSRSKITSSKLPPGKGGARRVPIDSAEAAPLGPGWKG